MPKVLGIAFRDRAAPVAAFELSFSIRKFKKKKVRGEIAFTVINLVLVQIQECK